MMSKHRVQNEVVQMSVFGPLVMVDVDKILDVIM